MTGATPAGNSKLRVHTLYIGVVLSEVKFKINQPGLFGITQEFGSVATTCRGRQYAQMKFETSMQNKSRVMHWIRDCMDEINRLMRGLLLAQSLMKIPHEIVTEKTWP